MFMDVWLRAADLKYRLDSGIIILNTTFLILSYTIYHSPFTHSPTHPLTHSPIHPFTHPPIHPLIHSSTHPPIHPSTHPPFTAQSDS